jgi:predicted O-linked N-acetylglucosamine transferase (SPINDLY family)
MDANGYFQLANAQRAAGQLDAAVESYRQTLRLAPQHADSLLNLGIVLAQSGRTGEAIESWQAVLKRNPNDADALANLGNLMRGLGRLGEALDHTRRAIALNPDRALLHSNLGYVYQQRGQLDEAIACSRHALELEPKLALTHSNLLVNLTYHGSIEPAEVFAEHRRWNARYAEPLKSQVRPHENDRDPDRRIRVGYVSADLRDHSIAYFMEPVLANHDAANVELFCYTLNPRNDAVADRLRGCGHTWRSIVGVANAQSAEMIRQDRIDILVDLAVHSGGHKLLLFARKPAPVQVTWLGYAGTTGLDVMDFRLTDPIVDPPGLTESLHTEQLVRLPRTQWCYRPPDDAPDVSPPPFERNSDDVTFGNATNLAKVTPQVIALWARAMNAASTQSRFALMSRSFADESTRQLITEAFAGHDVDASRLSLRPGGTIGDYFRFFADIDVCLDTFPFNGGTTTCHTLWMGVPVLTMTGRTSVSRVAASVLTNVGLGDLVAATPDEFVRVAAALSRDADRLRTLRTQLRDMMRTSPLCDAPAFVRDLETAYRTMWRAWCSSS